MKKIVLLLLSLPFALNSSAQTTGYIRNDTIKLTNATKNTTLIIETASKGHNWYLKDIGNGRTQFVEATITDVAHLQDSLGAKANDSKVIHNTGNESGISGNKGLTNNLTVGGSITSNSFIGSYGGFGNNLSGFTDYTLSSNSSYLLQRFFDPAILTHNYAFTFLKDGTGTMIYGGEQTSDPTKINSGIFRVLGTLQNYNKPANPYDAVNRRGGDSLYAPIVSGGYVKKSGDVMLPDDSLYIGRKLSVYNSGYKLSSTISTVANQGLCTDGTYFYIVRSTKIYKTDASFNKLDSTSTTAIGLGGNHIGAPAYWNGKIYVPISTFSANFVYSNQKIVVLDATAVGLPVLNSAAVTHTDNISSFAVFNNKLWSSNYVQGSRLQRYNLTTLASIDTVHLSSNIYLQQGIVGNGTHLYIANESSIYSVDTTGANVKMVYSHNVYNSEGEGLCFVGSNIYWNINYGLTNNQIQILTAGTAEIFKATQDGNAAVGGRFNTNRLNVGYASDAPPPVNSPMSIYTRFNTALVFDSGGPLAAIGHDNSSMVISNNTTFNGDNWHGVDTTGFQFAFFEHKANKRYEFRISAGGASIPTWKTLAIDTAAIFPTVNQAYNLGKTSSLFGNSYVRTYHVAAGTASLPAFVFDGPSSNYTGSSDALWETSSGSLKYRFSGTTYRNVLVNDVSIAANSYPRGDPAGGNVVYTMQAPDTSPTSGSSILVTSGGVFTALALKAPLASPALTGVPTAPTASVGTNTTQIATMAALQAAIADLPAYGELYEDGGSTAITITTAGTYYQWATSTTGSSAHTAVSASTDDITIATGGAGVYKVAASISFSGSGTQLATWAVFKNGVRCANLTSNRSTSIASGISSVSVTGLLSLAVADVITLRCTSDGSGTTLTPTSVNLTIKR